MSHIDPRIVISWMALHTVIATGLGSEAVLVETDRYPPLLLRVAWHVALWAFAGARPTRTRAVLSARRAAPALLIVRQFPVTGEKLLQLLATA